VSPTWRSVSIVLFVTGCARAPGPRGAEPGPRSDETGDVTGAAEPVPPAGSATTGSERERPSAPSEPVRLAKLPLAVRGFGDAVLITPLELGAGKPLLVAAHGAGDAPDWQCDHWAGVTRGRFVVLCPRGLSLGKDSGGYYFPDHFALEREVLAAVDALEQALGSRLLADGGVYTGYSQGATMGALMVVNHGRRFPHLILMEGGSGNWTFANARRFRATGGKSVAIVCGTAPCARRASASADVLRKAGLRAVARHAEGAGHVYDGEVGEQGRALFEDWLLEE
jgi:predicted esterase